MSQVQYETIVYQSEGRIVTITLNRPERLNALNPQMLVDLRDAWRRYNADDDAWVAIVTGAGRALCGGGDVRDVSEGKLELGQTAATDFDIRVTGFGPRYSGVLKPVIVAVNGICCGGGLDWVTEGDIVIASEEAEFFDPHVSIGLIANHEMVQLSRRLPLGIVLRMAIMGRAERMSAQRAYQLGLVSEVCAPERLIPRAREIAEAVLLQAPLAVRGTKQVVLEGLDLPMDQAIELGEYIRRENIGSEDQLEGPRAFVEKRRPVWNAKPRS